MKVPRCQKSYLLILSPFEGLFSRVLHTLMAQISRCHFGLDLLIFFEVAPNGSGIARACSRGSFGSIFELCSVKFSPPTVATASRTLRKCATPGVPEIMFVQFFVSCPESFRDDLGMIRGFIYDVFELRSVKFPSPTVATALK